MVKMPWITNDPARIGLWMFMAACLGCGMACHRATGYRSPAQQPVALRRISPRDLFVAGKGSAIQSADLQLVFWGTSWGQANASPSPKMVADAINKIVSSSYLSTLDHYNLGIRAPLNSRQPWLVGTNPGSSVSQYEVESLIRTGISSKKIPPPSDGLLYCVFLPGTSIARDKGLHWKYLFNSAILHLMASSYTPSTDPNRTLASATIYFSHELVDSITDPEGDTLVAVDPGRCGQTENNWCEVADLCMCPHEADDSNCTTVNGVEVQKYWSDESGDCYPETSS
jgi:hypothetical protein